MITGFNTDIDHQGRVFHVQTEDKGLSLRLVETLIYSGGEIVTARRTSYEELEGRGESFDAELLGRMEAQHKLMVRDIRNGRFDAELPKPFGYNIVSNQTLDEVVIAFLGDQCGSQPIKLQLLDRLSLREGTRPTVRMKVTDATTRRAVRGARIMVLLESEGEPSQELFSSDADSEGFVEASFEIPTPAPECEGLEIVCAAEAAGQRVEVRRKVKLSKKRSPHLA